MVERTNPVPDLIKIRNLLDYDANTGEFTWKKRPFGFKSWNTRFAGKKAGSIHRMGYRIITIDDIGYLGHRIAWLHFYGEWPEKDIDHINGIKNDNRIKNLRTVSKSLNQQNRKKSSKKINRSSIYLGVSWHKASKKWTAAISVNNKQMWLGLFTNEKDAYNAYINAKTKYHPGFI